MRVDDGERHILVVDDERVNRELLQVLLEAEGFTVELANTGEACLERIEARVPDLVLLDVMMPGIGGIETCARIRAQAHMLDLPVVFVTALSDRDSRIRGKTVGGDDFLTKPIDETELMARVRNLLEVKAYRDLQARYREQLEAEVQAQTAAVRSAHAELRVAHDLARRFQVEAITRLARAAEFRDNETAMHIQRMSRYCELIARRMGKDDDACERILLASPMHDVGKIGTPDRILLKPGRLDAQEFAIMMQHAEMGHRILEGSGSALLDEAATMALCHHEKWDGSGYPRALRGAEIPEAGRIVAVADVFDALTSRRVYKPAFSVDRSVSIMLEGRERHFDPGLLDLFLQDMDEVLEIRDRFPDESCEVLA